MIIDICDLQKIKNRLIQECKHGEICNLSLRHEDCGLYIKVEISDIISGDVRECSLILHNQDTLSRKKVKNIGTFFLKKLFPRR